MTQSTLAIFPHPLAGLQIKPTKDSVIKSVEKIFVNYKVVEAGPETIVGPGLRDCPLVAVLLDLHVRQGRFRRNHQVAGFHLMWLDHRHIQFAAVSVFPQLLAIRDVDSARPHVVEHHDLLLAGDRYRLRRAIRLLAARARPGQFPTIGAIREDAFVLAAAGKHDDQTIHRQRRTRISPLRYFGRFDAAVGHNVTGPNQLARLSFETIEFSFCSQSINPAIRERRRPARTSTCKLFFKSLGILMNPNLVARGCIAAYDDFVRALLLLRHEVSVDDDHRRPPWPHAFVPRLLGRRILPIALDLHICDDAVPLRTAVRRAITRLRRPSIHTRRCVRGPAALTFAARQEQLLLCRLPSPACLAPLRRVEPVKPHQSEIANRQQHRDAISNSPHLRRNEFSDQEPYRADRDDERKRAHEQAERIHRVIRYDKCARSNQQHHSNRQPAVTPTDGSPRQPPSRKRKEYN